MLRISSSLPVVACFVLFSLQLQAQHDPYYTHYMLNKMAYNPAVAGEKNAICANALTHQQWLRQKAEDPQYYPGGLPESTNAGVNPATNTFSVTAPFLKNNQLGLGLQIVQDKIGYQSALEIRVPIAFKLQFGRFLPDGSKDQTLAIGVDPGWYQATIDGTMLNPAVPDPLVPTTIVSGGAFDMGFGLYYTNQTMNNLYIGISSTHLLNPQVTVGSFPYTVPRHLFLLAGTRHKIGANLDLLPAILVKSDIAKLQVDVSARLEIKQKYVLGINMRSADAFSAILGYYIMPQFYVGYSYDFNVMSGILKYTKAGTHELYISYCFDLTSPPPPPVRPIYTPRFMEGYTIH